MKKKLLTSLLLAGTMALTLTACTPDQSSSAFELKQTTDVYAYSAVSAVTVLADFVDETHTTVNSALNFSKSVKTLTDGGNLPDGDENDGGYKNRPEHISPEERYQTYVDNVNKYMAIAENMMSGSGFAFEEVESDRDGFTNKIAITYADMTEQTLSYAMYYNVVNEQIEDGEKEIDIAGVFVNGEYEYEILGEQEVENDESETSLVIKIDAQNYIVVEYESETDEKEYCYSVYQDGQLVEKTSFEQEQKFFGGNKIEIEMLKDGVSTFFELEQKEERGQTFIDGKVEENGERFSFKIMVKVDEETGESIYQYLFGNKPFERQRNRHHHGRAPHHHH